MKPVHAPLVRSLRHTTASAVDAVVQRSLRLTEQGVSVAPGAPADPLRQAIQHVFAHFCERLVDRLNAAPSAHLQAFAETLGVLREPPVPARTVLVFSAKGLPKDGRVAVVERCTEAAAPPAAGDSDPVVFQTTRDLEVMAATLTRAFSVDVFRGTIADVSEVVSPTSAGGRQRATATMRWNALHIASESMFGAADTDTLQIQMQIEGGSAPRATSPGRWGITTPDGFVPLDPVSDTTHGLTRSGTITVPAPRAWPAAQVGARECRWLTFRQRAAMPTIPSDAIRVPTIHDVRIWSERKADAAQLDAAMAGRVPVDLSRDFYPFGERPRFGDVLYLASPFFHARGALVTLHVLLTNSADSDGSVSPIPPVRQEGHPHVEWEIHTRQGWRPLEAEDGTKALTRHGSLAFRVPDNAAVTTVNGVAGGWVRARLAGGNYGGGTVRMGNVDVPVDTPPSIASLHLSLMLHTGPLAPDCIVTEDGIERLAHAPAISGERYPLASFAPDGNGRAVIYLALHAQPTQLAGRGLDFYIRPAAHIGGDLPAEGCAIDVGVSPQWQVHGADGWHTCTTEDHTDSWRQSGFVHVDIGQDVASWPDTMLDPTPGLLWLRIVWPSTIGQATTPMTSATPGVSLIALNAVEAIQAAHYTRDLLGSSTGRPGQLFRTARTPVVGNVLLEICEFPERNPRQWVSWQQVDAATLRRSDPDARVFALDAIEGQVCFGDGRHGCMPPAGANNVRITYSAGGGARGNVPPGSIALLRTTIPYIEAVSNCEAAEGGQDMADEFVARGAALARLRHRDRAVCADDFVDLAHRAAPDIHRAACSAGRVKSPAHAPGQSLSGAGIVTVWIVPASAVTAATPGRPAPSRTLLARVKAYLEARSPAGIDLIVAAPAYLPVGVEAELAVLPGFSLQRVRSGFEARVNAFLHPVTGGTDGRGWDFGAVPHASELIVATESVDGLAHLRALRIHFDRADNAPQMQGGFVVCAGSHTINATHADRGQ